MQLAGDEKKIRALFSERAREEAQAAPRFEKLWRRALLKQQVSAEPVPRFRKSLVVIAATVLVAVAALFIAWSVNKTSGEQNAQTVAPPTIANQPSLEPREPDNKAAFVHRRTSSHSTRRRTLARRQQSERDLEQRDLEQRALEQRALEQRTLEQRALEQQAAMLANWKSPTESFVTSPTPSSFDSLPQLNESAKDLQSFLQQKESNQ